MTQTIASSSGVVTFTVTNDDVHTITTATASESITSWVPTSSDGDHWTMYVTAATGHTVNWSGLADTWSGGTPPQMKAGNSASFGMMKVGSTVIGFSLGDSAFRYPKGLVWNDQSGTVPTDNHSRVMDMLRKDGPQGVTVPVPPKGQWLDGGSGSNYSLFERLRFDQPVELETGNEIDGQDKTLCWQPEDGANLPCLIGSKNWIDSDGSGAPSRLSRNITIKNLGIDGGWRNRTSGTELQDSGDGHGIAGAPYLWKLENVDIGQTRGCGMFFDTTGADGSTSLGESIEPHILYSVFKRNGGSNIYVTDTNGVGGGITDGFLIGCVLSHGNIRGLTGTVGVEGAAAYIGTGGGWAVGFNHVYATDGFTGTSWAGYDTPQITHGFAILTASGTRFFNNQIADFGYHRTYTGDCFGLWLRLWDERPAHAHDFNVWTDEDAGTVHDYYAVRINTASGDRSGIDLHDVFAQSRAGTPTLRGIKLDASGGGSLYGSIHDINLEGVALGQMLTTSGGALDNLGAGGATSGDGMGLVVHSVPWDNHHGTNRVAHASGGYVADCRLGRRHVGTLTGNATSVTVTNLPEGETAELQFVASGASRNVNFSAMSTATDLTNPGNVAISSGGTYRAVVSNVNGTAYLVAAQAVS